jgi:C-terminal peptidase prc
MKIRNFALALLLFAASSSSVFASYDDVPVSHENYKGVSYVELQGGSDGATNFRPDDKITRAELFKIVFKVFGESTENVRVSSTFTDVDKNAWYAPYSELAIKFDLISTEKKLFEADKNVSKIEAMKILYRIYGIAAPVLSTNQKVQIFKDISEDHPYNSFIQRAINLEIYEDNANKMFYPYQEMTRGDFVDMLFLFDQWYTNTSIYASTDISEVYKAEILQDIWKKVMSNFYLEEGSEIDKEVLFQAMVKGMLQSLGDPYTMYIGSEDSGALVQHLTGDFEGIGAYLLQDEKTGKVYISSFVAGSNAPEVGLEAGDEIEEVDGISIIGISYNEIISRIKGPAGTKVTLKIRRGNSSHSYIVERRALKTVIEEGEIVEDDIWYIDINLFSDTSFIEVTEILRDLESQVPDPSGIVFDLRSNGGGYLNSALSIAGHFVPNSEPMIQLDYGSYVETINNSGKGEYNGIPLFVLIDGYSASASEILAAALHEEAGATLIGQTSFGKGSAQKLTQYWDGSILKITIAHWLSPNGNTIQDVGIEPDIEVTGTSKTIDLYMEEVKDALGK